MVETASSVCPARNRDHWCPLNQQQSATGPPGTRSSEDQPRDPEMSPIWPCATEQKPTVRQRLQNPAPQLSRDVTGGLPRYRSRLGMLSPASPRRCRPSRRQIAPVLLSPRRATCLGITFLPWLIKFRVSSFWFAARRGPSRWILSRPWDR